MKKILNKSLIFILLIAYTMLQFPLSIMAYDKQLNDGDIINSVNVIGSIINKGDVEFKKTVSKTNTYGEYEVKLEVKGKDTVSVTSTIVPIYMAIVFDRSGSMQNYCIGSIIGGRYERGTKEYCEISSNTLYPRWTNVVSGTRNLAKSINSRIPNAQIALVTFSDTAKVNREFETKNLENVNFGEPDGGTNIAAGLDSANNLLNKVPKNSKKIVVLIGDGIPEVTGDLNADIKSSLTKATQLKENGIEIYSIGYDDEYSPLSDSAINTLKSIATDETHYSYSDSEKISNTINNLVTSISTVNAGTSAVITDTIKEGFSYVEGSSSVKPTTIEGNKLTFNIGDITEEGKVITFKIKISENLLPGTYNTNETSNKGVSLKYISPNNNIEEKVITSSSSVYLNPKYSYTINYYLDSKENGKFDSKTGSGSYKDIINIDISNIKEGYKYDGITSFELEKNNQEISVIYTKKIYKYTINYHKDNLSNEKFDSKSGENEYNSIITINLENIPHGYEYKGENTFKLLNDNYVKKVLYTKIGNLKYTINYYKDSKSISNYLGSVSDIATYDDEIKVDVTKYLPEGYEYNDELPTLKIDTENNVLDIIYTKKSYEYKVNYYKDELSDENYLGSINGSAKFEDKININFENYLPEGYEPINTDDSLIITTKDNEYNVIYTKKSITYKVNYYFDNVLMDTKEVKLLYGEKVVIEDEFEGYKLDKIIENKDNIINVYYSTIEQEEYIIPPKTGINMYNIIIIIQLLVFSVFINLRKLN